MQRAITLDEIDEAAASEKFFQMQQVKKTQLARDDQDTAGGHVLLAENGDVFEREVFGGR